MSLLQYACFFLTILPCLSLSLQQPNPLDQLNPLDARPKFPQPFVFTAYPYVINYTHDTLGGHHHPVTSRNNFDLATYQAIETLQNKRTRAGANPADPIPANSFTFEVEIAKQGPMHSHNPRRLRYTVEGRPSMVGDLGLKYIEVGISLLGLEDFAAARDPFTKGRVEMCTWTVADMRGDRHFWIAKGAVKIITPLGDLD